MKRKKLLYIITQGSWGGAQRYVFDLAVNLAENYDITVAIGEPKGKSDLQSRIKEQGSRIKIIQLKHVVRKVSPLLDLLAIFELHKLYKTLKPDIVHLNSSKAGIIGSLAKFIIHHPSFIIIYTVHGWVFNEPLSKLRKNIYLWLEKFTARWKKKLIVLSEEDKQVAIKKLKICRNRLTLIPLGIESNKRPLTKKQARDLITKHTKTSIDPNQTWIGTIAGLYKTKGLDILIEAVAAINNQQASIFNLQFILIGDGPELTNLKSNIINHKLKKNVHLIGSIKEAAKLLPAFDLFVLPSRKEGLPYTLIEAMQQKIPVVATEVGGIPSLVEHKKTGLLVQPEHKEVLAKNILFALKNAEVCQAMALSAQQKIAGHHEIKQMIDRTNLLYQKLLEH